LVVTVDKLLYTNLGNAYVISTS